MSANNEIILTPDKELTLDNQEYFKNEILNASKKKADKIIIDMSNLHFIDSSGIGMLIFMRKQLKEEKKELILRSVTDPVMEIFKISDFDQLIKIEP